MKKRIVLLLLPLLLIALSSIASAINETEIFLGSTSAWNQTRIRLNDVQALFGGQVLTITSSKATLERFTPNNHGGIQLDSKAVQMKVKPEQFKALLETFIDSNFIQIKVAKRPGVPDESRITFSLINASGKKIMVTAWHNDLLYPEDAAYKDAKPLSEIYQALQQLIDQIQAN